MPCHRKHAVVICIMPGEASVIRAHDNVNGTGEPCRGAKLVQEGNDCLLVRDGYVDAAERFVLQEGSKPGRRKLAEFVWESRQPLVYYLGKAMTEPLTYQAKSHAD